MPIKENNADIEQRERLKREHELAPRSRICDIAITAAFCLFIGGFALLHIFMPDNDKLGREVLQELPEFSIESLFTENESSKYTTKMTKYLSDQFPFRETFINIKANTERLALRMENEEIMFGEDSLTPRVDNPNTEYLKENIAAADKFAAALNEEGIPTVLAIAGRRADVCDDYPDMYGTENQDALWDLIDELGEGFSGKYENLRDTLSSMNKLGEEMYYRTDHHWTTKGARYAYMEIWDCLPTTFTGGKVARKNFTVETVTEEFYGTSYTTAGVNFITPDSIELYRFNGDDQIPVTVDDTGETYTGLYRMEYLEGIDKYSVFLGENAGKMHIGTGERPTIMVVKDSFAQALVPFLAADFDILMVDPRFLNESYYRLALEEEVDAVLILMNADSLTTTADLKKLERGVK